MNPAERLIGTWKTDPSDEGSIDRFGNVFLRFGENGSLQHAFDDGNRYRVSLLHHHVDGTELVTDQPSAPREERTGFRFTTDGRLLLEHNGYGAVYVRSDDDLPWEALKGH